jgi:hypothetical protein
MVVIVAKQNRARTTMSTTIALDHPDATAAVQQGFEAEEHKTRHPIAVIFHFLFKVSLSCVSRVCRRFSHISLSLSHFFYYFIYLLFFYRLVQ